MLVDVAALAGVFQDLGDRVALVACITAADGVDGHGDIGRAVGSRVIRWLRKEPPSRRTS